MRSTLISLICVALISPVAREDFTQGAWFGFAFDLAVMAWGALIVARAIHARSPSEGVKR